MHAVISGRAGKALLLDGDSLESFDADDPSKLVPRRQADLHYLFGESQDLRIIEDSDLESITREFKNDCDSNLALDLTLISLDGELPDDIRKEAIEGVDELLADHRVVEQLENILYARPVPEDADLSGALKLCDRAGSSRVLAVLKTFEEYQPLIREVCEAWDIIPVQIFGGYERQAEFQHAVVREGFFRAVVVTRETQAAISMFLFEAGLNPYLKQLPNYRQVLQRWVAPFRQTDQKPPLPVKPHENIDASLAEPTSTNPEVNTMHDEMNKLLKSELSAIETYQQALEKKDTDPEHVPVIDELSAILDDHQRAASRIEAAIRQKGGEPVHSSGAWGTWSSIVMGTAQLFGDKAALKVLKEGEQSGLKEYEDVLVDTGIPQDQKTLISDLAATQRMHIGRIFKLIEK